jgi:RHS repeat-associated protein
MTRWPGGTVTIGAEYDVDGRLSVVRWDGAVRERYYYDARSLRVAGGGSYQVYGLSGELLGEYRPVPNSTVPEMWLERVYFAGRLVEHYDPGAYPWQSPTRDRLGSRPVARRYPFGEGSNADNDEFATYRKDTTAQHYYAWHRFYSATWGRFSSPDPYVMSGGLTHPQGWNRYSYVENDPVNWTDRSGLWRESPAFCDFYPDEWYCSPFPASSQTRTYGKESATGTGGSWEQPRGGRFVTRYKDCNENNSIQEERNLEFLLEHFADAEDISKEAQIPLQWILAWAAYESGWGHTYPETNKAIHNNNYYGLTSGSNWLKQSPCSSTALGGFACFANFYDSTYSALFSLRKDPKSGLYWTAATILKEAFASDLSTALAFQVIADLGHMASNKNYGAEVARVNIQQRLDCLKKNGFIQ